jgi:hypothetical protein
MEAAFSFFATGAFSTAVLHHQAGFCIAATTEFLRVCFSRYHTYGVWVLVFPITEAAILYQNGKNNGSRVL